MEFKVTTLCFKSLHVEQPHYIHDILHPYTPSHMFTAGSVSLFPEVGSVEKKNEVQVRNFPKFIETHWTDMNIYIYIYIYICIYDQNILPNYYVLRE